MDKQNMVNTCNKLLLWEEIVAHYNMDEPRIL